MNTQSKSYTLDAKPFVLQSGEVLPEVTLAYSTYGKLSPQRDNAILVFHALSGSHNAAGRLETNPAAQEFWTDDCKDGWWSDFIGAGKAFDTDKYFVISANFLGGCYGSTGPSSIDSRTGKPYGATFPDLCISDIVDSQCELVKSFGIEKLHAAVGLSISGMMVLNLATRYPDFLRHVLFVGSSAEVSTLQRLSNFEQILAIENDVNFNGGNYYEGERPKLGLALARMIAHKSYVSLAALENRANTIIKDEREKVGRYRLNYSIESYMLHQGDSFIKRFDANTYIIFCTAWQKFDLPHQAGTKDLKSALAKCKGQKFLIFSIDSDVCFYPEEQTKLADLLRANDISVQHFTVSSTKGHDSFLLEPELFADKIAARLAE